MTARIFMIFTDMGSFIIQLYQKSGVQMLKSIMYYGFLITTL